MCALNVDFTVSYYEVGSRYTQRESVERNVIRESLLVKQRYFHYSRKEILLTYKEYILYKFIIIFKRFAHCVIIAFFRFPWNSDDNNPMIDNNCH